MLPERVKRGTALLLAACLLCGCLVGCNREENDSSASNETITDTNTDTNTDTDTDTVIDTDTETQTQTETDSVTETETETETEGVSGIFDDPTVLAGFVSQHNLFIKGSDCELSFNPDGSITATGNWDVGENFNAQIKIPYVQLMGRYYPSLETNGGLAGLPNAPEQTKYPVLAVKLRTQASVVGVEGLSYSVGAYGLGTEGPVESLTHPEGTGDAEYLLFDMTDHPVFTKDHLHTLTLDWAFGKGTEENVGASVTLYEIRLFESMEAALAWSGVTLTTDAETEVEEFGGYDTGADITKLEDIMQSIFHGDLVRNETVMFLDYGDERSLLYHADTIVSVTSYDGSVTYVEGKDYELRDGKLVILEGSSMPCITSEKYYNSGNSGLQTLYNGVMTPTYAMPGEHMTRWQVNVTYTHSDGWDEFLQTDYSHVFANLIDKMKKGKAVTVMFYGDSITYGADSSFVDGYAPYQYSYPLLVVQALAQMYKYQVLFKDTPSATPQVMIHGFRGPITYVNAGIGGWTSATGVDRLDDTILSYTDQYGCDLLVVGFGMNDGGGTDPKVFRQNMENIVQRVVEKSPTTSVLMLSTMMPHPDSNYDQRQRGQEAQLLQSAEAFREQGVACAVVCMTSISQAVLERKEFRDYTGNNLNHPNDFFTRIYAQAVLQALLGCYD